MDDKIRGSIEHGIELQIEGSILNGDNKWVFEEYPISSKKKIFS